MKEYNTKAKEEIILFLDRRRHKEFTPDEILKEIPSLTKSTLYRILNRLESENIVHSSVKGRKKSYGMRREECNAHLHLYCRECGNFIHLSKDASEKILKIIEEDQGFEAMAGDIEIKGRCKECLK